MNRKKFFWAIIGLTFLIIGTTVRCEQIPGSPLQETSYPLQSTVTSVLLDQEQTDLPDAKEVTQAYLDAWVRDEYSAMYNLLTSVSKAAISADEFEDHYAGIALVAALHDVSYEIQSVLVNPDTAQVKYRVTLSSMLVGDISRDTLMNLSLEDGQWRVQWDDMLVIPELQGGNYLLMERGSYIPSRANIYDRFGRALVAQSDAIALGLYPDRINDEETDQLFNDLSEIIGSRVETIRNLVESAPVGADWYIPLGEVSIEGNSSMIEKLSNTPGVGVSSYKSRYYFDGGIAPHVVGYVSAIQPEEVEEYQRLGYQQDERVGRIGLEKWGEKYLAGQRGGALYVFNAQGKPVTLLAEADAQPSQAIYTTLDRDFQLAAQEALSSFRGAIVVLERDNGRVLAMVSSPGFNPNAFEPINLNSKNSLYEIISDPDNPLLNRATQGQYPLGSVFKIITMAAALESEVYSPDTTYQCGYFFEEIPGVRLHDWTYDSFLQNGHTIPSGLLTLTQGLMRSCNPFFWHIGLDLYTRDMKTEVSTMSRNFGLGTLTGIEGLEEEPGNIPDPTSEMDAVNMAIGQGDILVTPLQVANFIAAIGNGGKIYLPQVVEKIASLDSTPVYEFEPKLIEKLPLHPNNLTAIQEALVGVIRNEDPRGTAWHVFTGLDIPIAGKTGTAQTNTNLPHAWFAGYTFAEQEGYPDIAVAVLVENIGEGSDYAAPIFRRIVENYFSGQPQKLYWWESEFNITVTPTINNQETPQPTLGVTSIP
jgi:penicillin-binding protein 2